MKKLFLSSIISALFLIPCVFLSAEVIPYSFPDGISTDNSISVTVDDQAIPVLSTLRGSIVNFGMDGQVEVVLKNSGSLKSVVIRPLSSGINAEISGNECRFVLDKPRNLSVEFNGKNDNPVFIFANAPEKRPDKNDPAVRYFEAGKIHEAGEIRIGSGESIYLEGGAVVHGTVRAVGGEEVALRGPGIFDCRPRMKKTNQLFFRECKGVKLEDFILIGTIGWSVHLSGSEDIDIDNMKVISWRANSDGLDIEYCRRVNVKNCFWRTSDDCIAVKALFPPGFNGMSEADMTNPETLNAFTGAKIPGDVIGDIDIQNCVLWNDWPGNGFEVGFELRVDKIRNIFFRNNDIIHVRRGAAFSIHNCDRAEIENVLVENVRVEDADELFDLYIGLAVYSEDCPGPHRRNNPCRIPAPSWKQDKEAHDNRTQWIVPLKRQQAKYEANRGKLQNITFRNIQVFCEPGSQSIISGYSNDRNVENVLFEKIFILGEAVKSAEDLNLFWRFAEGIVFE